MKYLAAVLILSGLSFAGVAKFSAKHVLKPAAVHAARTGKKAVHLSVKAAKVAKRVAY